MFLYVTLDDLLYALGNFLLATITLPGSSIHGTRRRRNADVLHIDKYVIQIDVEVADVDFWLLSFLLLVLVVLT